MEFPGVRPYIYIEGTGAASEGLAFSMLVLAVHTILSVLDCLFRGGFARPRNSHGPKRNNTTAIVLCHFPICPCVEPEAVRASDELGC